jgi:DNA-binding transcriptional MerR regulator
VENDFMSWHMGNAEFQIPAKRYRIGELVRYSPFSRQTIHNYTIMGLIREAEWTAGGHRLYDESVFPRLSRIVELRKTKSLTEIRRILKEEENEPGIGADVGPPGPDTAGAGAGGGSMDSRKVQVTNLMAADAMDCLHR